MIAMIRASRRVPGSWHLLKAGSATWCGLELGNRALAPQVVDLPGGEVRPGFGIEWPEITPVGHYCQPCQRAVRSS